MNGYIKDPLALFNLLLNKTITFFCKGKDEKINISSKYLFYFSYIIFMVTNFFFKLTTMKTFLGVDTDLLAKIIIYPLYVPLLIKIIWYQKYNKNEILKIVSVGIIILISSYFSGVKLLVTAFIFILSAKDIDIDEVVKVTLIIQIICISIIVLMSLIGSIENRTFSRKDGTVRYSFGFTHPNAFTGQILQLCICFVWTKWQKLSYKDYLFMILISLLTLKFCDSRTSFLLIILFVGTTFIYRYIFIKNLNVRMVLDNILGIITKLSIIILPVMSLLLGALYDPNNKIYVICDKFISGRIKLLNDYYVDKGYSIIGQKIKIISTFAAKKSELYDTTALDNAYGHIAVRYGLIVLIIFIIGYYLVAQKAIYEKNNKVLICILIYILFGITEIYIFNLPYNVLLLLFSVAIYSNKKISNKTFKVD